MTPEKEHVLIVGAGAIGRGYLAPYLVARGFVVHFADCDPLLVQKFEDRRGRTYQSAVAHDGGYMLQKIPFAACYSMDSSRQDIPEMDYVFFCVGIKQLAGAAHSIWTALAKKPIPKAIYSVENDPDSVEILKSIFSNGEKIYFGVPDVITSSTAPLDLLQIDPLCVMSEVGELYLQGAPLKSGSDMYSDEDVSKHWICKKYLHNTPHAALAYLGAAKGYEFIHQAIEDTDIEALATRLMNSISQILQEDYEIDPEFLTKYAAKELKRFKNKCLFDPILRVGRNPEIKLQARERIVHVANLLQKNQQPTHDIAKVIRAALSYTGCDHFNDKRRGLKRAEFLETICGIPSHTSLGQEILRDVAAVS